MQKIDFNKDWMCRCLTRDEEAYPVTLPHDAMPVSYTHLDVYKRQVQKPSGERA